MIILGVILLVLGFVFAVPFLWTIGLLLTAVGVVFLILGTTGRVIGGRKYLVLNNQEPPASGWRTSPEPVPAGQGTMGRLERQLKAKERILRRGRLPVATGEFVEASSPGVVGAGSCARGQ